MNTFRLVQEAAAAISEALGQNFLSGEVSAEGGKVTYTATEAPDGGWAIEITDLRPRGGKMLSKGMLAGVRAQIAKAATKQAGALRPALPVTTSTEDKSAAAQPSVLPAVTREEPATIPAITQGELVDTVAEEGRAPSPFVVHAAEALYYAASEGYKEGPILVDDHELFFHSKEEPGGVTSYTVDEFRLPNVARFTKEAHTEIKRQIATLAECFYTHDGPFKEIRTESRAETWYSLKGFSSSLQAVVIRVQWERSTGVQHLSVTWVIAHQEEQSAPTPPVGLLPSTQEGTGEAITYLEAALGGKVEPLPAPAGYTCRELTTPTKGGIAYYLRSTIDAGAGKAYRLSRNTIKYFVTGDPHLEVKETDAKGGIKRLRARGTFRGRKALFESVERDGTPTGIAIYQDENERRLDWYNDEGLLFRSQRWQSGKRLHKTDKNHEA